jgi:hypothetical protein
LWGERNNELEVGRVSWATGILRLVLKKPTDRVAVCT